MSAEATSRQRELTRHVVSASNAVEASPRPLPPALAHPLPNSPGGEGIVPLAAILRKRIRLVLLCVALGVGGAFWFCRTQPKLYQSKLTLRMEESNPNLLNTRELDPRAPSATAPETYLMTQVELLKSDALVLRTLDALPSRLTDGSPAPKGATLAGAQERQNAANQAKSRLNVRVLNGTRVIEVDYEAESPGMSAAFLNVLAEEFMKRDSEEQGDSWRFNNVRLNQELASLRDSLHTAETRLRDYANAAGLVITDENRNLAEKKLGQLQEELSKAEAERISKQSLYDLTLSSTPGSLPQALLDNSLREYQSKLTELERQQAELNLTLTPEHPSIKKLQAQITELSAARDQHLARVVQGIRNEYSAAQTRERLLRQDYERQTRLVADEGSKAINYAMLKREVDTKRALYESILQKVKEYGIANTMHTSNVQVIDAASPPLKPHKPLLSLYLAAGFVLGALTGLVGAIVLERSDTVLRDPGQIARQFGVLELGAITSISRLNRFGIPNRLLPASRQKRPSDRLAFKHADEPGPELVVWAANHSQLADGYRNVVTSILFSRTPERPNQVIMLTSAGPKEGKTTTCCNLALALAELKMKVLLIDADLRSPQVSKVFGVKATVGLADLLRQEDAPDWRQITHAVHPAPNVWLIPGRGSKLDEVRSRCSFTSAHAAPMLTLLQQAREQFDVILIDTPPTLYLHDARVIGRLADAAILVARAGRTRVEQVAACVSQMKEDRMPLIGTILNDWNPKRSAYGAETGYFRYKHYYHKAG